MKLRYDIWVYDLVLAKVKTKVRLRYQAQYETQVLDLDITLKYRAWV